MTAPFKTLPVQLTALRLLLVPPMWVLALRDQQFALGVVLLIALLTDVLDGQAARWLDQSSAFSSRFDSLADRVLTISVIVWLVMLKRNIFLAHPLLSIIALVAWLLSQVIGLVRFGSFSGLHLTLAKLAGAVQALFVLHAFLSGSSSELLFYTAVGLWIIAALEEIAVQLTHDQVDGSIRSIVPHLLRNASWLATGDWRPETKD